MSYKAKFQVIKMKYFHKIMKEISQELDIQISFLSKNWIIMLAKGNQNHFISGYKFDLLPHGLGIVFDDKYALYHVLTNRNIPIIQHHIIYHEDNPYEYAKDCKGLGYLTQLFQRYNHKIVLKTLTGTCGTEVYFVESEEELTQLFSRLISSHNALSVSPYYPITYEFRTIMLKGKAKLLYKKIKPLVIGDGIRTKRELLMEFNPTYFKTHLIQNAEEILKLGEEYEYDWRFNLAKGAKASMEIEKEDLIEINKILEKVNELFNHEGFYSIDIIKTTSNQFYVMEINSGVMIENFIDQQTDGYQRAKAIYKEAVMGMFNGNK